MAYQNNDIEKYLSGELTPSERHALEQKALKDPFLAEALEGAENAGADNFSIDLQMLQHSIHQKTLRRAPKIISLNGWQLYVGIAAGLLLLAVSSFIVLSIIQQQKKSSETASLKNVAPADSLITAKQKSSVSFNDSLLAEAKPQTAFEKSGSQIKQERDKKNGVKPIGSGAIAQSPVPENLNEEPTLQVDDETVVPAITASPTVTRDVASAEVADRDKKALQTPESQTAGGGGSALSTERMVKGKVFSSEDGNVLPGVNVLIKGTNKGTITDAEGNFEVALPNSNEALVFSFIGLTTQEVKVTNEKDVAVKMDSDVTQLSEMVVTGYGVVNDKEENFSLLEMAEPEGGRKAFKKYLEEQLNYPRQALESRVEGKVTIQFTVQPNGQLSDFHVLKGLGYGCDEEVIRLIKEGPTWHPSKKDDQPVLENVKIRLKFDLPEKK